MKRWLLVLACWCSSACGDGAGGARVVLRTQIALDEAQGPTFVTGTGWTVALRKALVATGPLYYYEGEPAVLARTRWRPWRWLVREAHAHPGHYDAGDARGQMLAPFSADLLAGATALPNGDGVTGPYRSAWFSFAAPSAGPAVAALAGAVALAEGRASKGDLAVEFRFTASLADVAKNAKDGRVIGCTFDPADVRGPGTVTVRVRPRGWFNLVDFSSLAPGTAEQPTVVSDPASPAHVAFSLGLSQQGAYRFSFTPESMQ